MFFQKLSEQENVDLNMRILKKNNTLTISIMPGSGKSITQPIVLSGTPEELDAEFFDKVYPEVVAIHGLQSNIEAVKKETEKAAKPAEKKETPAVKKDDKKAKSSPPGAKEPDLFGASDNEEAPVNDQEETTDADEEIDNEKSEE